MDPKNKKIAGGIGVVLAAAATLIGVDFNPPSVEQYTKDMNTCAAQIKANQPTTACSPEVAEQAKAIAADSKTVADATKDAAHPNGQDVVYWIAPENGAKKSSTPHVFHICQGVSPLNNKTVNHGSVTEAYAENATRITKQIPMEQRQCGYASPRSIKPPLRQRDSCRSRTRWARSGLILPPMLTPMNASGPVPRLTSSSTLDRPALRAVSTAATTWAGFATA